MILKLEAKYLQLEKTRNKLLIELSRLDDSLLNTPAEGDKWSINQVVAHLVLVDELITKSIQWNMRHPDKLEDCTLANTFKAILLKLALMSWMKFKAPAVVSSVPETASLPELSKRWDDIRFKLEDVLTAIPEEALNKCIFKHPNVGPLTIMQTLTFLQDHFDHHLRQIQQVKKVVLGRDLSKAA